MACDSRCQLSKHICSFNVPGPDIRIKCPCFPAQSCGCPEGRLIPSASRGCRRFTAETGRRPEHSGNCVFWWKAIKQWKVLILPDHRPYSPTLGEAVHSMANQGHVSLISHFRCPVIFVWKIEIVYFKNAFLSVLMEWTKFNGMDMTIFRKIFAPRFILKRMCLGADKDGLRSSFP